MGKYIWIIGFALMVIVQLSVPVKMVMDSNAVVEQGGLYKFKTAPVDPKDPFRGNYVWLRYEAETYPTEGPIDFDRGEAVFALIGEGADGYAEIEQLHRDEPVVANYLKAEVRSVDKVGGTVSLVFPFTKFFMHEEKAEVAERIFFESLRDSTTSTYALISVYQGEGILQDVMIDGTSLRDLAGEED
jgi:hypothetical protein